MSITFSDPSLFLKGTATAYLQDDSGNFVYWSNKFQSASITTSVTMGEIRGGLGNPVLMTLPSDSNLNVSFTAADFSLFAKAAQTGATISTGAPVLTCGTGTVTGSTLYLPDGANAVTPPGYSETAVGPRCWVNGYDSYDIDIEYGQAYPVNPDGSVKGFTASPLRTYKIWYYQNQANAKMATIGSLFSPAIYHFTAEMPVYTSNGNANQGDLAGILTVIVPRLKLGGDNGGITGDQTNPDTTIINGMALAADAQAGGCNSGCSLNSSPLAYYIYAPCKATTGVDGVLGALGGAVTVAAGSTVQLTPAVIVDGTLTYSYPPADMSYQSSATGVATVTSAGVVSGVSAGDAEITVTYTPSYGVTFTDFVNVTVTSA